MKQNRLPHSSAGFTLVEILIVFSIITVLILAGWMSWRSQIDKANDAKRKEDLQKLSVALEEFYNDHDCYPPAGILDADFISHCNGNDLQPYLSSIPCDPLTHQPYALQFVDCTHYRLLATLNYQSDSVIATIGCDQENGCGWPGFDGYNYGITSFNLTVSKPPASQAGSGSSDDYYACNTGGFCTYRGPVRPPGCTYYWINDAMCGSQDCSDPLYQCVE